jgi:MSHA biogenesis protein MshI
VFSLKSKSRGDSLTAVIPCDTGTAVATIRQVKSGKPLLEQATFQQHAPGHDADGSVRRIVRDQDLGRKACTTLLGIGQYQLLMVEAPEVPQAELKAAIRWRIRDLIDFHIDDAVLDVFDTPPSGARGVQEHLYAVVARSAVVRETVDRFRNAGAGLDVIDIPELALRNVAAQLDPENSGLALLFFEAERGLITLTRGPTLYLARSLEIGYTQLNESPALMERLALELQRSMDYYDRHFQQAPVTRIAVAPFPGLTPLFVQQLEGQVGIPATRVAIDDVVGVSDPIEDDRAAEIFLAVAAALRAEQARL